MTDVSVVVPAYRAAGFIDRALHSALGQPGVELEVIVVDDACPDGTAAAVRERFAGRPEVDVIRLDRNSGPSVARNTGIARARGEWVAVLDADDAFEPGRLGRLVGQARALDADILADNVCLFEVATETHGPPRLRSFSAPTQIDVHRFAAGARPGTGELDFGLLKPLFRRETLHRTGVRYRDDVRHGEDFLLYLDLLLADARFWVTPEPGYLWTHRSSGRSQTPVDYGAQVVDTRALLTRSDIRCDEELVRLLEARIDALVRLGHAQDYATALRSGHYGSAALSCLRHPRLLRYVARSALKRWGRPRQAVR